MAAPLYPLASVDNALGLLTILGQGNPLRVTDAARQLGVAPSTAHRLLAMLEHHGYAKRRFDSRKYVVGPAFEALARSVLSGADLPRLAQPALDELGATYNESVLLGVLDADGVRFVAGRESELPLRVGGHFGRVFVAHTSASGLVLLAALARQQLLERYPSERLIASSPVAITRRRLLERELKTVRSQGYALVVETTAPGVSAVATPVFDQTEAVIAAVTLIAPTSRLGVTKLRACVPALQRTAASIAARLGRPSPATRPHRRRHQ